jgi:hypothetical protein
VAGEADLIRDCVVAGFKEDVSEEFTLHYLAEVRANMRDAERSTRRAIGLVVLLAATFELLRHGSISEATFFSIKLESFDFALLAIPVVIAFLCYEISGHVVDSNDHYWVHSKIIELRYPSVCHNGLELFLLPVADPFGQAMRGARFRSRNRVLAVLTWARFPLRIIAPTVAACMFIVYAIVQLLLRFGFNDVATWAASILASIFIVLTLSAVATETPHRDRHDRATQAKHSADEPPVS